MGTTPCAPLLPKTPGNKSGVVLCENYFVTVDFSALSIQETNTGKYKPEISTCHLFSLQCLLQWFRLSLENSKFPFAN